MSITHEEARRLIQFRADDALKGFENNLLETHLNSCQECQKYAAAIHDLKSTLQPMMQRKWNQHPLPHIVAEPISRNATGLTQLFFFATRIIAIGVIFIAFLLNVWQFTRSNGQTLQPPSANIPLIPTPSLQSTTTQVYDQNCEKIVYEVKKDDTIEKIANRFSVPAEDIQKANNLGVVPLKTSVKLSIPVCSPTPPGTPNTITTTFTPLLGSTTLTPVNGPTQ